VYVENLTWLQLTPDNRFLTHASPKFAQVIALLNSRSLLKPS
jgi:hypothetical protein